MWISPFKKQNENCGCLKLTIAPRPITVYTGRVSPDFQIWQLIVTRAVRSQGKGKAWFMRSSSYICLSSAGEKTKMWQSLHHSHGEPNYKPSPMYPDVGLLIVGFTTFRRISRHHQNLQRPKSQIPTVHLPQLSSHQPGLSSLHGAKLTHPEPARESCRTRLWHLARRDLRHHQSTWYGSFTQKTKKTGSTYLGGCWG